MDCQNTLQEASAKADSWREQVLKEWCDSPVSVEAMKEDSKLLCQRSPFGSSKACFITARWNWLQRNEKLLGALPHKQCRKLTIGDKYSEEMVPDLLCSRIGGEAVLPKGTPWPTLTMPLWIKNLRGYLKKVWTNYLTSNRRGDFYGRTIYATYLGTYDLRGSYPFKEFFPSAISLFASTYFDLTKEYIEDFADAYCPGIVVPIFDSDQLELISAPKGVPQFPARSVQAWGMPDFEKYNSYNAHVYDRIAKLEPNTSSWINLSGEKIGGYPPFIQHDVLDTLNESHPELQWHYIATYSEAQVQFGGDGGNLNVLAGWDDKAKTWRWHCATAPS